MYCEKCGKNVATTFIKKVVNGVSTQKNLCGACAEEMGYSQFNNNSFANILSSMLGEYDGIAVKNAKRCQCCSATFNDIAKRGKVGCGECYTTFADELLPYLKRLHGNVKHIGKVPNSAPLAVSTKADKINALRNQLNIHIKNEEFEQAAKIRDQIREIEGQVADNE